MDCVVDGVTKSQTGLSDFHFHYLYFIHSVDEYLGCFHILVFANYAVMNIVGDACIFSN